MNDDVPSPIDLRTMADAREWERTAMTKRPWRVDVLTRIGDELAARHVGRVLELGAGSGFLAAHLLARLPSIEYVALDFSAAMHELARARLGSAAERIRFVERDFLDPSWPLGLGLFDAVVTLQAVHELRHKRRASTLHAQVRTLLAPGGVYLVCDHVAGDGGMANTVLYMTTAEQVEALAGFGVTRTLMSAPELSLIAALP